MSGHIWGTLPGAASTIERVFRPATTEEARLLEIPTGTPVIHLIHNASDEDGNTLEVSESVWPADRIVVIDDYDIAQAPEDAEGLSDV